MKSLITVIIVLCLEALAAVIPPILIPRVQMGAKSVLEKQNEKLDSESFNVTFNKLGLALMTVLVVLLAVSVIPFIVLYVVYDDMPIGALIGTCAGCAVCATAALILEIMMYRWKICVRGDAVTFIPLAGKKRGYNLSEVSHVDVQYARQTYGVKYTVYFNGSDKKAFTFNNLMVGADLLEQKLLQYSSF